MAELRDKALLLRRIPYGDTSLVIHLLTETNGRITLMARGARRARSPFRATMAPLHALHVSWRPGRTGMGTLTALERGGPLLEEDRMLEGLELLALADSLFREGDTGGFAELTDACALLRSRKADSGLLAAAWHLLQTGGLVGELDHCWQCGKQVRAVLWQSGQVCCRDCGPGREISPGLRRGIDGHMRNPRVYLPPADTSFWRGMIQDVLKSHRIRPLSFGLGSGA